MFENPAQKLKWVSKFLFIFNVIGAIILAFAFGIVEEEAGYYYTYTDTVFYAERFFGILIGVPLASYIECLCLYGFGVLIENSDAMLRQENRFSMLEDIENNLPII